MVSLSLCVPKLLLSYISQRLHMCWNMQDVCSVKPRIHVVSFVTHHFLFSVLCSFKFVWPWYDLKLFPSLTVAVGLMLPPFALSSPTSTLRRRFSSCPWRTMRSCCIRRRSVTTGTDMGLSVVTVRTCGWVCF